MFTRPLSTVVPAQIMMAVDEIDFPLCKRWPPIGKEGFVFFVCVNLRKKGGGGVCLFFFFLKFFLGERGLKRIHADLP